MSIIKDGFIKDGIINYIYPCNINHVYNISQEQDTITKKRKELIKIWGNKWKYY